MEKPTKTKDDLVSLNNKLMTDYSMQELEQRLETNPLFFGLGDDTNSDNPPITPRGDCDEQNSAWCICDGFSMCEGFCVDLACVDLPGCITKGLF